MGAKPIIHKFTEVNKGKYRSVRHYELKATYNGATRLSTSLNISKNRNCALSMPEYWVKKKEGNNWSKCLTGLFITNRKAIFKGDIDHKKHLVIFRFSNGLSDIMVYYFENFYTTKIESLLDKVEDANKDN